jgi:hypothetical protein
VARSLLGEQRYSGKASELRWAVPQLLGSRGKDRRRKARSRGEECFIYMHLLGILVGDLLALKSIEMYSIGPQVRELNRQSQHYNRIQLPFALQTLLQ